jgi:ubiquitin-like modifier-activating enzyme ATG7
MLLFVLCAMLFLQDVELLSSLMASHDVTFLLTDTRESRWLPTLIAAANDTLLINSALGMDTYLIQRHGGAPLNASTTTTASTADTSATTTIANRVAAVNNAASGITTTDSSASDATATDSSDSKESVLQRTADSTTTATSAGAAASAAAAVSKTDNSSNSSSSNSSYSSRLGCYFCSDVVAPENSQLNRTLDHQCTVTRPGLAPIAAALAVELMVAVLHHPLQHHAPADSNLTGSEAVSSDASSSKPLGLVPHQVRAAAFKLYKSM